MLIYVHNLSILYYLYKVLQVNRNLLLQFYQKESFYRQKLRQNWCRDYPKVAVTSLRSKRSERVTVPCSSQLSPAKTRRYFLLYPILTSSLFYCPSLGRRRRNIEHLYTRKKDNHRTREIAKLQPRWPHTSTMRPESWRHTFSSLFWHWCSCHWLSQS